MSSGKPKESYFYTTHYPSEWSSGPTMNTLNPDKGYRRIESLAEAKALAEKLTVGGYDERRCVTTYGVQYAVDEPDVESR